MKLLIMTLILFSPFINPSESELGLGISMYIATHTETSDLGPYQCNTNISTES